jgi:hypothetical protein
MTKRGRPSKYDPKFCDAVVAVGEDGGTLAEMAVACGVNRETINDWIAAHPEFSDAIKLGIQKAQAWWEEKGRIATFGGMPGFNATSYIFHMKNRFKDDWRDRVETEISNPDGSPVAFTFQVINQEK